MTPIPEQAIAAVPEVTPPAPSPETAPVVQPEAATPVRMSWSEESVADVDALLNAAITGQPVVPPAAPIAEATPVAGAASTADPVPTEEVAPAVTPPVEEPERIIARKIPTDGIDEMGQRAIALQHDFKQRGETITLAEAVKRVETSYAPIAPPVETAPAQEQPQVDPREAELQKLVEDRTAFKANGELSSSDEDTLTNRIEDLKAEIKADAAVNRLIQQQSAEQARRAAQEAAANRLTSAIAAAVQIYPHANDLNHEHGQRVAALTAEYRKPGNPNDPLTRGKDSATVMSQLAAHQLASEKAAKGTVSFAEALAAYLTPPPEPPAAAPAQTQPAAPKTQPFRPASGATATVQPKVMSEADKRAVLTKTDDPNEIDAHLFGGRRPHLMRG